MKKSRFLYNPNYGGNERKTLPKKLPAPRPPIYKVSITEYDTNLENYKLNEPVFGWMDRWLNKLESFRDFMVKYRYVFGELINGKPDLRGLFWIIVSLIVVIEQHILILGYVPVMNGLFWEVDFTPVYIGVISIICTVWIIPLALMAVVRLTTEDRHEVKSSRSVMSLLLLYGFLLSTYSEFPLMWLLELYWYQWCKTILSALMCTGGIVYWLRPDIWRSKYCYTIICVITTMYILQAVFFMLFIFDKPMFPRHILQNLTNCCTVRRFQQQMRLITYGF